ncbi:MAG: cupin domain-containing protein [Chlamydiales bacterium]|nr:cupin domain-containing protein [Chlamydiales bacterium]
MAKHQCIQFEKMSFQKINEQVERKMAVGEQAMVLEHRVKKGFVSQKNETHINEQFTYVLEGKLQVETGGEVLILEAGDMIIIPPNQPHTLTVLEDVRILDVFSPVRKEWL